jgi:hypothetical protein
MFLLLLHRRSMSQASSKSDVEGEQSERQEKRKQKRVATKKLSYFMSHVGGEKEQVQHFYALFAMHYRTMMLKFEKFRDAHMIEFSVALFN